MDLHFDERCPECGEPLEFEHRARQAVPFYASAALIMALDTALYFLGNPLRVPGLLLPLALYLVWRGRKLAGIRPAHGFRCTGCGRRYNADQLRLSVQSVEKLLRLWPESFYKN